MTKTGVISILISTAIIISCSLAIKIMSGRLDDANEKISAANEEIERLSGVIKEYSEHKKRQDEALNIHVASVAESGDQIVEKVYKIESDDSACDWLDNPLPLCVQEQFKCRNSINSGRDEAAGDTIEAVRETNGI
jgi:chromosome segregation ATPase